MYNTIQDLSACILLHLAYLYNVNILGKKKKGDLSHSKHLPDLKEEALHQDFTTSPETEGTQLFDQFDWEDSAGNMF